LKESKNLLPILRVSPADIAEHSLVVGDPARAAEAAKLLDNAEEKGYFREYRTFTGQYNGKPITISSHGVGAAGASVCFEELIQGGAKTIIRAGTCGAMKKGIKDGEFIIGTGAIREDGASPDLMPLPYPAIADRHVTDALLNAANTRGHANPYEGIILTLGFFYDGVMPSRVDYWLEIGANVVAVEMEFATLLVIANMRGVRAGGLFTSDGNMTEESDPLTYDPHRTAVKEGVDNMIKIALDALSRLD
jgi:uridine phosphorylase